MRIECKHHVVQPGVLTGNIDMRFACKHHGVQSGILISPDLSPRLQQKAREIVDLLYECDGEAVWACHVSEAFARQHNIRSGTEAWPDQFGEWEKELECCCQECFEEFHGGRFGDDYRWKKGGAQSGETA